MPGARQTWGQQFYGVSWSLSWWESWLVGELKLGPHWNWRLPVTSAEIMVQLVNFCHNYGQFNQGFPKWSLTDRSNVRNPAKTFHSKYSKLS